MKRVLLFFLTVSLCFVVLFVLSPSVFAAEDASAETLDFYFGGKLFSSSPYNQQDLYWSDICDYELEDGVGFVLDEQGVVNYIVNDDLYYVFDSDHQMIKGTDDLKPRQYSLELVLEFSVIDAEFPECEYSFSALVPGRTLGYLAHSYTIFKSDVWGDCRFVSAHSDYFGDYVAFAVGLQNDISQKVFVLMRDDLSKLCNYESLVLLNGSKFVGADPCDMGLHNYVTMSTLDPTCTEAGCICCTCSFCYEVMNLSIKPLGHDRNFWGECRRCASNLFGDIGTNIGNGVGDLWDGAQNVGSAIIDGANDLIDKGKDALEQGKDAVGEKVSSFVTTIAIVAGLSLGILVAILISRLAKKLKKKK